MLFILDTFLSLGNFSNSFTFESFPRFSIISVDIPFGIVSDIPVIADLGPKIPVKVSLIGSSTSNLKTELEEYGINNVLMKVYIVANVNIQVILPFATETTTITEEIPLAINLVNGIIPQVYGGGYFASSPIVSSK